jgi:hypothetical protein
MRHRCAGCWKPISQQEPQFRCHFCDTGFVADNGIPIRPCRTRYHPGCIHLGLPFCTRLPKNRGMFCLPDLAALRHSVCEACMVRAVVNRDYSKRLIDLVLLMLERARLVDTTNHWSPGTIKTYQSKYRILQEFECTFKLSVLHSTRLKSPPHGAVICLMWAQERYSLYPAEWRKKHRWC